MAVISYYFYGVFCARIELSSTHTFYDRACDTLHLIAIAHNMYYYLVSNYAYPAALLTQDLRYVLRGVDHTCDIG